MSRCTESLFYVKKVDERTIKAMKKLSKITTLLLALALMMSAFAACGGSGGSGDAGAGEAAKELEPNMGMEGIVFAVPEDWKATDVYDGGANFKTSDEKARLWSMVTTEESLKERKEYDKELKANSVAEYYEELNSNTEAIKKENGEVTPTKLGEWDAVEMKNTNDAGECVGIGRRWLIGDKMYSISITAEDMYDDEGKYNKNAAALSDDVLSAFEDIIASVKEGDGEALKWANVDASSVGNITFEKPEGYTVCGYSDEYVSFKKDGSNIRLDLNTTTEDELKYMSDENGNSPASLEEAFNNNLHEGVEETEIAGYEGYTFTDNEYEDGKRYFVYGGFLTEDRVYNIHMGSDAWDSEGNIKEDAEALTDDDIAAFKKFIESIKKK